MKQQPCCARFTGRITQEKGNLQHLAKRAARRTSKGLLVDAKLLAEIDEAKASIEYAKQGQIDHEAEHAGEAV